jgi:hypothetical protein
MLVLLLAAGAVAFLANRPLAGVGRAAQWVLNHTVRRRRPVRSLPASSFVERAFIHSTVGALAAAVATAVAVLGFDYLALLCALRAVGRMHGPRWCCWPMSPVRCSG